MLSCFFTQERENSKTQKLSKNLPDSILQKDDFSRLQLPISMMLIPCEPGLDPLEDLLWNGTGLNLSTNNGLDLSLTTYEGLNLSQNSLESPSGNAQDTVLNLTQPNPLSSDGQHQQGQTVAETAPGNPEVGLNLSLQNGMNLTRPRNEDMGYYYDTSTPNTYDNQATDNNNIDSMRANNQNTSFQTCNGQFTANEQNRNSPLNLEQRSSPLNLTAVQQEKQYQQQQTYYYNSNDYQQQQPSYSMQGEFNPQSTSNEMYQANSMMYNGQQQGLGYDMSIGLTPKIRMFCSSCNNQEFNTTAELNKHMERHNNEAASASTDSDPSSASRSTNNLIQSINLTACVHCGQEFRDEPSLLEHQKCHNWEIEAGLQSYGLSDLPNNVAPSSYTNNLQVSEVPSSSRTNKVKKKTKTCSHCSGSFNSKDELKNHLKESHSGPNDGFQCPLCAKVVGSKAELNSHHQSHHREKPHQCDSCSTKFWNLASLRKHTERVHDKTTHRFSCNDCGKKFYGRHDLARHRKTHGSKPSKKCQKCDKVLRQNHVCKEPEVTDFPCKICNSYMESEVAWGYHMWKHTKDPKYIITASSSNKNKPVEKVASMQTDQSPAPPEAHAVNSMSQLNQPLCLQTSGFVKENEVKPLDMQVCNGLSK